MFFLGRIRRWFRDLGRNIFYYHDGVRSRRGDPYAIGQRLETEFPSYAEQLSVLAKDESVAPPGPIRENLLAQKKEAVAKLIVAARTVFNLEPLTDDAGVSDPEALAVLVSFFRFMEGLAVEAGPFAT